MKNNIYLSLLILSSIFISTVIWDKISINFGDTQILGEYYNNSHHALNDPLRFIAFVFIPIVTYLSFKFFLKKKKFTLIILNLKNSKRMIFPLIFYF